MEKKTALVIMAAGMGSRYGVGIKQLEGVGMHNELIIDYSIHDAIEAGFNEVIFIIRHEIEDAFRERIGARIEPICEKLGVGVRYAFQDLQDLPEGFTVPEGRGKPWGTGHAVLAARKLIDCPMSVINADDYYGKQAFRSVHDWLVQEHGDEEYCMAGFVLKNTMSENGSVTRGVCKVENGRLADIQETFHIAHTPEGGAVAEGGQAVDINACVSMNFWGLQAAFVPELEKRFSAFLAEEVPENPTKAEYLLPMIIGQLLKEGKATVEVLETGDKWFGVTYAEDKPLVVESFRQLIQKGVYEEELFSDLLK